MENKKEIETVKVEVLPEDYLSPTTYKFKKGNPGRAKGTRNKIKKDTVVAINAFIDDKLEELPGIWTRLSNRDKCNLLVHLIKVINPVIIKNQTLINQNNDDLITQIIIETPNE
jgi:hypothetical protein